jgi:ribosomal protein L37E
MEVIMRINCSYCGSLASNKAHSNCPSCGAPLPKKSKKDKEGEYSTEIEETLKEMYKYEVDPRPMAMLKILAFATLLFLFGFLMRSNENIFVLFSAISATTLVVDAAILLGYLERDDGRGW